MNHKTIKKKLLRYLDDELPQRQRNEIAEHLQNCRACREKLKYFETLWQPDHPVEPVLAPPFLWTRLSIRLEEENRRSFISKAKNTLPALLRPVLTAVALLFTVWAGIQLGTFMTLSTPDLSDVAQQTADSFGLNYFEVLPPGSPDIRILALTESETRE
ncbi:MAG: zf-HC2 domain-containing protein [candidate division KSB1 bacterium]|nr:zf-HC2 domain-containing protein [candidate division KSB1 bacterium]